MEVLNIASIGLTERQARGNNLKPIGKFPFAAIGNRTRQQEHRVC